MALRQKREEGSRQSLPVPKLDNERGTNKKKAGVNTRHQVASDRGVGGATRANSTCEKERYHEMQ